MMNGEKDQKKYKRTLKGSRSERNKLSYNQLKDEAFQEELQKIKQVSELIYKEGVSRLLDVTRNDRHKYSSGKLSIGSDTSISSQGKLKGAKLPKIIREDSPKNEDLVKLKKPSISPYLASRISPLLQPLFHVTNYVARAGFKSRIGCIGGKPKIQNQDALIIKPNLQNIKGQYLFGVCSGHGAQGHLILEYFKENFIKKLECFLPTEPKIDQIPKALISATEEISASLSDATIDIVFSGCTALNIIISGNTCVCANLGDCSAVIGREGDIWQEIKLSNDHNLQNKKERERMITNNARIAFDKVVYEDDDDDEEERTKKQQRRIEKIYMGEQTVPGLEITRSIGDKIGKFIGMISIPEIKCFVLSPVDKFIIIGTRGLWKYRTGLEAICIVRHSWESNLIEKSYEDLISEADRRWRANEADKSDITAIVIYLKYP